MPKDCLHPAVLAKLDSWLDKCDNQHEKCASIHDRITPLPTRLLDLSTLPNRKDLINARGEKQSLLKSASCKLIETSTGSTGRYICLSYCWGKSLAYTTTTSNRAAHMQDGGILFANLPGTLQDALYIARYFGIDMIWIDCVCIVQDDKADWEREAAQMASVYSNAYLTIATTRAANCGEGFLQPRNVNEVSIRVEDEEGGFNLYFTYDDLTISPGSMEAVTHQPLRVQRVRYSFPHMDTV